MKKFISIFCTLLALILFFYMLYGLWQENRIPVKAGKAASSTRLSITNSSSTIPSGTLQPQFIDTTYKGYSSIAKLFIPKIQLDVSILENYSEETLALSATKFYGPAPNEPGNLCIAGHNYNKENMFNHLIDLSIGDTLFLTDNQNGRGCYRIYDIYKVSPTETSPLSQETNGNTELTLITCTNYSSKRLIVKASKI